jgi:DNA repair ATPase RecN
MYQRLKKVLDLIQKLNSATDIISKADIKEQYDNLEDFKSLTNKFDDLLKNISKMSPDNGDEVEKVLFEIHKLLTTYEWHFSEISDLNTKLLKKYKDKLNN